MAGDLAAVLHATAAELRAGPDPAAAWEHVLGRRPGSVAALERLLLESCGAPGRHRQLVGLRRAAREPGSGPHLGAAAAAGRRAPRPLTARRGRSAASRRRVAAGARARVRAAVASVVVAAELGSPLAPALERIAASVALDEEATADLSAALAGPKATARLLAWLPALGLVLGSALGADPVNVVLGGGIGTWAALTGVVLTVVGRAWTRRLVRAAASGAVA